MGSLQQRFNWLLGGLFAVLLLTVAGLRHWQNEQERLALIDKESFFSKILELQSESLYGLSDSFSIWNEMADFAKKPDADWGINNIDAGLGTFKATAAWVFNLDGQLVYTAKAEGTEPITGVIFPNAEITKWSAALKSNYFFIKSDQGPIEVVGYPIQYAEEPYRKTPAVGYFLSGRLWNAEHIKQVEDLTETRISFDDTAADFSKALSDYSGQATFRLNVTNNSPASIKAANQAFFMQVLLATLGAGLWIGLYYSLRCWVTRPLSGFAQKLAGTAQRIDLACRQIESGSESLGDGVKKQAESLNDTTNVVKDVSASSVKNASKAEVTSQMMSGLTSQAAEASRRANEISSAINRIQGVTDEAVKIISVIESIAFQTNLLALNAAVEAARAGEAGKGFAVVADEVRNLAKRSAEAAQNTANTLKQAKDETEAGTLVVQGASKVFKEMDEHTMRAAALVGAIANDSLDQTINLNNIQNSVQKIEEVARITSEVAGTTQQAGTAMAACSSELTNIAEDFRLMVGIKELTTTEQKPPT